MQSAVGLDYQALLPQPVWQHVISFLSPPHFIKYAATCKLFHAEELRNKYYLEWFKGQGCAGYHCPQLANTVTSISREEYYKLVQNLICEFKIVSLPNSPESTTPSYTSLHISKHTESLLVFFHSTCTAMQFSSLHPYAVLNTWRLDVPDIYFSSLSSQDGNFYLALCTGYYTQSLTVNVYALKPNGIFTHLVRHSQIVHYCLLHEEKTIVLFNATTLRVYRQSEVLWEIYYPLGENSLQVIHIGAGLILVDLKDQPLERYSNYHLHSLTTGEKICSFNPMARSGEHVIANIKEIQKRNGETRWLVVIVRNRALTCFEVYGTRNAILCQISLKATSDVFPVSVHIHTARIVVAFTDGSISVIEHPLTNKFVHQTVVPFSGSNLLAAEVLEDSRVFFTTAYGLVFALDFSSTDYWQKLPTVFSSYGLSNSQLVNKLITTMLHHIGDLVTILMAATGTADITYFMNKYDALKNWFEDVRTLFSDLARFEKSPFVMNTMSNFNILKYIWTCTNELTSESLQKQKKGDNFVDQLLANLNAILDPIMYPHFPLRKTLQKYTMQQQLMLQSAGVLGWANMAKQVPKSITLDKIYFHKLAVQDNLSQDPELFMTAMDAIEEIEGIFMRDLAQSVVLAVSHPDITSAMTTSSTLQHGILDSLYALVAFHAFDLIKVTAQNSLSDFLTQFQLVGDLNISNKQLATNCTQQLSTKNTMENYSETNIERKGDEAAKLEMLVKNFLASIKKATESNTMECSNNERADDSDDADEDGDFSGEDNNSNLSDDIMEDDD